MFNPFKAIIGLYKLSAPLRWIYNIIAIVSITYSLASLFFGGFFAHSTWVNKRLAESYDQVEDLQPVIFSDIFDTVPNRSNGDRVPSEAELKGLRENLIKLSGVLSQVDAVGDDVVTATNQYRSSIADLSAALVLYDPEVPETKDTLLLAVDGWDKAASSYAKVIELRINRYRKTISPSA